MELHYFIDKLPYFIVRLDCWSPRRSACVFEGCSGAFLSAYLREKKEV